MKARKIITIVLAALPLVLLAAGLLFRIGYGLKIDLDDDPYNSFEDGREIITIITLYFFAWIGVPCAAVSLRLGKGEFGKGWRFAKIASIIELFVCIPIVLLTAKWTVRSLIDFVKQLFI